MLLIESPYRNKDKPFRVDTNQTHELFCFLDILIITELFFH